jgi:hypothetical protein
MKHKHRLRLLGPSLGGRNLIFACVLCKSVMCYSRKSIYKILLKPRHRYRNRYGKQIFMPKASRNLQRL